MAGAAVKGILESEAGDAWFAPASGSARHEDATLQLLLVQPAELSKVARSACYPSVVRCLLRGASHAESSNGPTPEVLWMSSDVDTAHPLRLEVHICRLVCEQMPLHAAALLCEYCHIPQSLRTPSGMFVCLLSWAIVNTCA